MAIRGFKNDGHHYIGEAIARGASAVITEKEMPVPPTVAQMVVSDSRDALARLSCAFFEEPSREMALIGITGTNGKTTVAYLLESIWEAAGLKSGVISTVDYRYGKTLEATHTTPESWPLQKMLREMVDSQVTHCVMEVTSHAIDLKRVVGCHFDGAIFTNLSVDHLDYHRDLENYYACKERLFTERLPVSEKKNVWAAVNGDDPYGLKLARKITAVPVFRFGFDAKAEIFARRCDTDLQGLRMEVASPLGSLSLHSPLVGKFNASNILAAVTAAIALKIPGECIETGIARCAGAPGRMEWVPNAKKIPVVVDFAHTPQAMEHVLNTLKSLTPGRLIVVFGCGGDRDRSKRPMMGRVASQAADRVIVTSDNPRTENPQTILEEIMAGIAKSDLKKCTVQADRREAIREAVGLAGKKDCVAILGKGHETVQIVGNTKLPFDDRKVALEILNGI